MKKLLWCITGLLLSIVSFAQPDVISKKVDNPNLKWWKEDRFGMFVHWGPVSLVGKEISWSREAYGKSKYDSLYLRFNPEKFNATEWVAAAKAGGMKYIVFTAKHHDGFCNWDTKTTTYNIMNAPFNRDVCKELASAAHAAGIRLGWYFSPADWRDSDCRNPVTGKIYEQRMLQQVKELLSNYGKIDLLWIDYEGSPCPGDPAAVYNLAKKIQPGIIVNNRLDVFHTDESHGWVGANGDYATPEGFVAGYGAVPWETCTNLGHQWAWKFNDQPRSITESALTLLKCVGGNGNLLLNVGPDSLGQIPPNFLARLQELGKWIQPRAMAIYKTQAGNYTPGKDYVCTRSGNKIYLHLFHLNKDSFYLPAMNATIKDAAILINGKKIGFTQTSDSLKLYIPSTERDSIATTICLTLKASKGIADLIVPFSTTNSLGYKKKATASGSIALFLHNPEAAIDDNPATHWKLGRKEGVDFNSYFGKVLNYRSEEVKKLYNNTGWLQIDLGKPQKVSEIKLNEYVFVQSVIKSFEVQYKKNGDWITIAADNKMGDWSKMITPVVAQQFRLVIKDSDGFFGIKEFQLF